MFVRAVAITDSVRKKIENKHGVNECEIEGILIGDKPIFIKSRGKYLSIGYGRRHLTIIFNYDEKNKQANIITAYPSSKWQIKLYKKMKK